MDEQDIRFFAQLEEELDAAIVKQNNWDVRFLTQAKEIASWSKDPSTKTGAVIVAPDRRIVSLGYNGFPRKMEDRVEWYANRDEKYSRTVHCEMNAAIAAKEPLNGHTLYTWPFMSCDRCFVHMVQYGITRFVAPIASADKLERWGDAFNKVRNYAKEMDVELVEIPFE